MRFIAPAENAGAIAIASAAGFIRDHFFTLGGGGTWVRPPPRGPPRKPLLRVLVFGSLSASSVRGACDDLRNL